MWLSILACKLGKLLRRLVSAEGDRVVVLEELEEEAAEDDRVVGGARGITGRCWPKDA